MKLRSILCESDEKEVQKRFMTIFSGCFPGATSRVSDVNWNGYGWKVNVESNFGGRIIWSQMEYENGVPMASIDFGHQQPDSTGDSGWVSTNLQPNSIELLRRISDYAYKLTDNDIGVKFTATDRKNKLYIKALQRIGLRYNRDLNCWTR